MLTKSVSHFKLVLICIKVEKIFVYSMAFHIVPWTKCLYFNYFIDETLNFVSHLKHND
jgi:hypothetical protein